MTNWISRVVVLCAFLTASASLYAHHSLAGVYALGTEAKVIGALRLLPAARARARSAASAAAGIPRSVYCMHYQQAELVICERPDRWNAT